MRPLETAPQDTARDSNEDEAPDDDSQKTTPGSASRKKSAHGLELLSNGVVSMRSLDLSNAVPTKTRDPDAQKLDEANLTVSKACTLFSFVLFSKHQKTEKHRDEAAHWKIFHSAAAYCLSEETKRVILDADKEDCNAYLIGLAKITQQR